MTINQYQLLPDLSPDEYAALRDDIALRGVMVPVEIDDDLNILDGHHRVMICEELGIDYPVITRKDMSEDEKIEHVLSLNLNRRHLNDGQMKELISELRIKGYSIRKIADMTAIPQTTVYRKLQGVPNGTPDHVEGADGKTYPAQQRKPEPVPVLFGDDTKGITEKAKELQQEKRDERRAERIEKIVDPPPLVGKYSVIYADPPWPVGSMVLDKWESPIDDKYPTMEIEDIISLPVEDIAAENCSLFLWTTHRFLPIAFEVIEAWGFKYHCCITWDKHGGWTQFGFHKRTEFLLFAYKGKIDIDQYGKAIPTLISEPKGRHSKKPDSIRKMIKEKTKEPRIEMFAREEHDGWKVWGNEVSR